MNSLQTFRTQRALLRAVLLWFALSLGAAFAAPLMLEPQALGQICSANGDKDQGLPNAHGMQCAACLPFVAPPPALHASDVPAPAPYARTAAPSIEPQDAAPAAVHARGPPAAV